MRRTTFPFTSCYRSFYTDATSWPSNSFCSFQVFHPWSSQTESGTENGTSAWFGSAKNKQDFWRENLGSILDWGRTFIYGTAWKPDLESLSPWGTRNASRRWQLIWTIKLSRKLKSGHRKNEHRFSSARLTATWTQHAFKYSHEFWFRFVYRLSISFSLCSQFVIGVDIKQMCNVWNRLELTSPMSILSVIWAYIGENYSAWSFTPHTS